LSEYIKILTIGVPQQSFQGTTLSLYPNPFHTEFTLEYETNSPVTVRCADPMGRILSFSECVPVNGKVTRQISLQGQPSGIYFLAVSGNGTNLIRIVIKQE
jgi:hypothetical protein